QLELLAQRSRNCQLALAAHRQGGHGSQCKAKRLTAPARRGYRAGGLWEPAKRIGVQPLLGEENGSRGHRPRGARSSLLPDPRVERVPEAVAEEVEAEQRDREHARREDEL